MSKIIIFKFLESRLHAQSRHMHLDIFSQPIHAELPGRSPDSTQRLLARCAGSSPDQQFVLHGIGQTTHPESQQNHARELCNFIHHDTTSENMAATNSTNENASAATQNANHTFDDGKVPDNRQRQSDEHPER